MFFVSEVTRINGNIYACCVYFIPVKRIIKCMILQEKFLYHVATPSLSLVNSSGCGDQITGLLQSLLYKTMTL